MLEPHILRLLGRERHLFDDDIQTAHTYLKSTVESSTFLVIGGAGSIGQALVREIFSRSPKRLHVVDSSENALVELVRDIRSSLGYIDVGFQALPLDYASAEFDAYLGAQDPFDYVLNLAALKHVRSEKDPYSLMRMIHTNVVAPDQLLRHSTATHWRKYFGVSTDKAVNPTNAMGATKRLMEVCMLRRSGEICVSSARFANVAFSNGSLLDGFTQRFRKRQPLSAPADIRRYFITPIESGQLCLLSCLLAGNGELFFPSAAALTPLDFPMLAQRFLDVHGYDPYICQSEDEARDRVPDLIPRGRWPCYFFSSDTSGEKPLEEFVFPAEEVDKDRFLSIGVIQAALAAEDIPLSRFFEELLEARRLGTWTKEALLDLLSDVVGSFDHNERHKSLDTRM